MSHVLTLAGDTAIRSFVSWTVGFVMGIVIVGNVKRVLAEIRDHLDDRTPGGLGEVAALQHETNQLLRRRR
jgi:hypothetical protein